MLNYRNIIKSLEDKAWVGLTDKENEGEWRWLNGEPVLPNQNVWYAGEPNDYGNNEDCAELHPSSAQANDLDCTWNRFGVCEINNI